MAINHAIVRPLDGKTLHANSESLQFVISSQGQSILPGSFAVNAIGAVMSDTNTQPATTAELIIDPSIGAHAFFQDITVIAGNGGVIESFLDYPRFIGMRTDNTMLNDSLGVETHNAVEWKNGGKRIQQGLCKGSAEFTNGGLPFTIKPDNCINNSNNPLRGNQMGMITVNVKLADSAQALFGKQNVDTANFTLANLNLTYDWIPDDGKRPPLTMRVYEVQQPTIASPIGNISTMVSKPCDSVHMSFLPAADLLDVTKNSNRRAAFPGVPPGGGTTDPNYGAEQILYAINDVDNAIVNFELDTRESIEINNLRSYNLDASRWGSVISRYSSGVSESYGIGIAFGGYLDFSNQSFAMEIRSQISSPHNVYCYYRCIYTV